MQATTGSLAAHFPTRRRIFGTPGADSDALVKQAQAELKLASEEAKKTVFRFDFDLSGDLDDAPKKKKKSKKKKKKSKSKSTAAPEDGAVDTTEGVVESELVIAAAPVAVPSDSVAKPKASPSPAKKQVKVTPEAKTATANAAPTVKKTEKANASKVKESAAEAAGFLKLRKPTSSDSEVMKMQLRYGRGKRNLAAIAHREKKKKEQQQQGEAVPGKQAPSDASGSGFQFNFFS